MKTDEAYEKIAADYARVIDFYRESIADTGPERETSAGMFTTVAGYFHGIDHWARVGLYARFISRNYLAREAGVPGSISPSSLASEDRLIEAVTLAAFFHDCARLTEGAELSHGRAAEKIWRQYSGRKKIEADIRAAVSQALLFHVDHPSVDPEAGTVTICLCNADRLDRVRLRQRPAPQHMYDDGLWRELEHLSKQLYDDVHLGRVLSDLGPLPFAIE